MKVFQIIHDGRRYSSGGHYLSRFCFRCLSFCFEPDVVNNECSRCYDYNIPNVAKYLYRVSA